MLFEHFFSPHSRHTTRNVTQHSNKDMIFFSDINKEWDDELLRNFTAAFSTWVKTFQSSLKCNDFKSYDGIFFKKFIYYNTLHWKLEMHWFVRQ